MKFFAGVDGGSRNNRLDFVGDLQLPFPYFATIFTYAMHFQWNSVAGVLLFYYFVRRIS